MRIHKEGHITILLTALILFFIVVLQDFFFPTHDNFHYIVEISSVLLFIFILRFFRHPRRYCERNSNHVISPCDGKVVVIEEVFEPEFFGEKRLQVSIFMSPFNVHVNWYPIDGIVKHNEYHKGKYLVAFHPKSSTENERTSVVVENDKATILFRQIAGALARRIVCYAEVDDEVKQGKQFGFIKFGSRIDLFLPLDAKIDVKIGQKVTGKKTILAHLK